MNNLNIYIKINHQALSLFAEIRKVKKNTLNYLNNEAEPISPV